MNKLKKIVKISIISIIILVVLVIAFISPLTKYFVEKYDIKYTGREITMDWAYVNPFSGYLHFSNLKIYELDSDTIFFSTNGLSANITMYKLLSKNYEISQFKLEQPQGVVVQNDKYFNFNDLIEKLSPTGDSSTTKEPLHFSILNIKIVNGEFHYSEVVTPINYFIKNVNIESEGYRWDVDTIPITFSFLSGIGSGDMEGNFTINSKNKDYSLAVLVHKFDLNIIGQYVKDLSNYGSFKAFLDADFKSEGNLIERDRVTSSGNIQISDFHFGKTAKEDYASFDKLVIAIHELSPQKLVYFYDSVSLNRPYFKYEKYDYLDNVQTMFGKKGANVKEANADGAKFNLVIEIANYIKVISKNFLRSNYRIDRVAIYDGEIKYNDYSLSEKFSIELNPFTFTADSVDKTHKRVNFKITSDIKPYGHFDVGISINPKDSSDFDLNYNFQKVALSMFNPYLIKYTSFPLDRGTVEVKGLWTVRNGIINSNNHLIIIDPRVGNRLKNKNSKWLPMRFIMFFVRERGNVIDYEIPITRNLKNPKLELRDVIFDALENVFVKPATTPYLIVVRNVELEIEKSLSLKWEMRNSRLTSTQKFFLKRMVHFIKENPEATIVVNPQEYELKEKEYILFYEAKKRYFMKYYVKNNQSFNKYDSIKVEKMSIKDSLFVHYLNGQIHDSLLFTVQDKCLKLIGFNVVDLKYKILCQQRTEVFMNYFKAAGIEKRVKVANGKIGIPYNGYSLYKIEYKGDFPEYLLKAYRRMNKLNNEAPRRKFKRARQKNKIATMETLLN
jgi:hypothetical protein